MGVLVLIILCTVLQDRSIVCHVMQCYAMLNYTILYTIPWYMISCYMMFFLLWGCTARLKWPACVVVVDVVAAAAFSS